MKNGENNWVHLLQKEIKLAQCEIIVAGHQKDHTQKIAVIFPQLLAELFFNFSVFTSKEQALFSREESLTAPYFLLLLCIWL